MVPPRNRLLVAAQWLIAAAVVFFAIRALRGQWNSVSAVAASLEPRWQQIFLATALVVAAYALLIEVWRRMILASGKALPFPVAARIWFVSNLGKYVPGKVWSIASMALLAREHGVSGASAATSAVVVQIANLAAGAAVIAITGAQVIDRPALAMAVTGIAVVALALTPYALPYLTRAVRRLSGREFPDPVISHLSIWVALLGSAAAWVIYGIAFQLFASGILGRPTGPTAFYIAAYTASYIIGFLALFAPGGAVVREGALVAAMTRLGLATPPEAIIIALTSRVWLTVTELAPSLLALAIDRTRNKPSYD